jgi:hypothetical protein
MAAKLTRLTHKIAIQLHLAAGSCTIRSSRSRRPFRKLLDAPSYSHPQCFEIFTEWKIQVEFFPFVTPCSVAVEYQRFRGPWFLHLQGESKVFYRNTKQRHKSDTCPLLLVSEYKSRCFHFGTKLCFIWNFYTRMYPKVSGLAAWSENCKWYSSLPLGAVVSLFCASV